MTLSNKARLRQFKQLMKARHEAILVGLVWASELTWKERIEVAWGIIRGRWGRQYARTKKRGNGDDTPTQPVEE